MLNSHALLCKTYATMYNEDAWDEVGETLEAETDIDSLKFALEELLVIAAGFAVWAANAAEVDPMNLIDSHYKLLRGQIENFSD